MKSYEKRLLNHLQTDVDPVGKEMLSNVRQGLGSLGYTKGNPLTKTEITLNIENFSFGNRGRFPNAPIFIFGLTDYYAAYVKNKLISPQNGLMMGTVPPPVNTPYFGICGKDVSTITANSFAGPPFTFNDGDLFIGYINDDFLINGLHEFADIRLSCQNVAYGTFLNSFVSDLITINTIRLVVPIANINQYINPIHFTYQTLFGKTFTDDVDPRQYITSTDFQQQICDIPINLPLDKNLCMSFNIEFTCPSMSIILFVEKVEPLTHK
jgi:hypothetical protein